MNRHLWMIVLLAMTAVAAAQDMAPVPASEPIPASTGPKLSPIRDGHLFLSITGKVGVNAKTNRCLFIPDTSMTDGKGLIPEGTEVPILPCNTAEQLLSFVTDRNITHVKLATRVTQYHSQNYLYPVYFVPVRPEEVETDTPSATIDDPNMPESIIPAEIEQMLRPRQFRLEERPGTPTDRMMINRTGWMQKRRDKTFFSVDGMGRNIDGIEMICLPNTILELVEDRLDDPLFRYRYRTTGIVTEYQGKTYLLLTQATRTYTNGNLGY